MKHHTLGKRLGAVFLLSGALATTASLAATTSAELKQLEGPLTPLGAERAGNKDASIPAWSGKWLGTPAGIKFNPGEPYPDPYASEKPLFVITAQNVAQYEKNLTEGQIALLKKYPATFKMPVYPSHRDFRYDDATHKAIVAYAPNVEMLKDGNGVKNPPPTVPFPIPKTGLELLWNLVFSSAIETERAVFDQAVVYPDGNIAWGRVKYDIWSPKDGPNFDIKAPLNTKTFYRDATELPLRDRGSIITGYQLFNSVEPTINRTWMYNPGTRRVRQSPDFGYDQPLGPGGFRTVDDDHFFNGSPERYDWKIVGKREIYVPYNNYRMLSSSIKYKDLLTPGHAKPDDMRYEMHRVWVLEATLKSGFRHQYAKRSIYLDEDSWYALLADNYDTRGRLWRTNIQANLYAYDAQRFYPISVFFHDLVSGAYMADRLTNEGKPPQLNGERLTEAYFAPDALRSSGN
ncbi:MAG: DUF1329 domain-containing protein [Pseudomonadales bacterium]|uniref:DUF1329 domain-containing protein n=1 Tax=Cupriavidus sp. TaxID=1873897 RepID=UPI00044E625B